MEVRYQLTVTRPHVFLYRLKFFIILHFFIKLNLTLYATSICLLRVLLNLHFDQKGKKCREKTVPDYLPIYY